MAKKRLSAVAAKERIGEALWNVGTIKYQRSIWQRISAAQLFVGSFALLILLGTVAIQWIPGVYAGERLSWLDALFTVTSAVCVTGLTVVDTATRFTPLGQGILLVLIQLGGLGIMAFTTLILVLLGKGMSLRSELLLTSGTDLPVEVRPKSLLLDVFRFTLAVEMVGAILLYGLWAPRMGWGEAVWPALFHAVSAFCNAGFSIFSNSLISFADDSMTLFVITLLVIAGGLGFVVVEEIKIYWTKRKAGQYARLPLHAKIVLLTTTVLLVVGTIIFALFEADGALRDLNPLERTLGALFLSATPRTAGFNTVDYAHMSMGGVLVTMLLMLVGGSPGSTAGGLKTTTVALLLFMGWEKLRGRMTLSAFDRSIPEATVRRAVGVLVVGIGVMVIAILLMVGTELRGVTAAEGGSRFVAVVFEVVSAFSTVGLSLGLTPILSEAGRVLVILLMFIGRVGPLAFVASLSFLDRPDTTPIRYAQEDVSIG